MANRGKVAIILLNYNGANDTIECIESIRQSVYKDYDIIVVDNCSTDNSVAILEEYTKKNKSILLCSDYNNGFSAGNNIGIKKALEGNYDYILLLNNDTIVEPDFLSELLNAYETVNSSSVLTGTILYAKEKDKIWYAGGSYSKWTSKAKHFLMNDDTSKKTNLIKKINYMKLSILLDTIWTNDFRQPRIPCYSKDFS